MEKQGYERFGLTSNPFQDLASETLREIHLFHVDQEVDQTLDAMKEEVLERQRKAVVVLLGPLGVGKTERLKVAVDEAARFGAFSVYVQLTTAMRHIVHDLAVGIRDGAGLGVFARHFTTPRWYRDLQALTRRVKKGGYDPEAAGAVLAAALNANAPAFLLLNDLHALAENEETDLLIQTLHALTNHIAPGVFIAITSYPGPFAALERRHPTFTTRLDRVFRLRPLRDDEAALLVAKRLPARRLVEDLDPLYPFTDDAIAEMNATIGGNPRRLLKLADRVLEAAVRAKVYHVDAEFVQRVDPGDLAGVPPEPAPAGRVDLDVEEGAAPETT